MKTEKNRKLKGTVLLAVVATMALLIIFMGTTLVLASAANNRAHKTYATTQAEYTAQAAIKAFTTALEARKDEDGNDIPPTMMAAVQQLSGAAYPNVVINNTSIGRIGFYDVDNVFPAEQEADGWVPNRIKVENLGAADEYVFGKKKVDEDPVWFQPDRYRITATARLGSKDEKTVSLYMTAKPIQNSVSESIEGLQTVGGSELPPTDGQNYSGALVIGLENTDASHEYSINNTVDLNTYMTFINGDLYSPGQTRIHVNSNDFGMVVTGNYRVQNDNWIIVDYAPASTTPEQKEIPYLYVDGKLSFESQGKIVNNQDSPFNMFAGTINIPKTVSFDFPGVDLYLMDDGGDNVLTSTGYENGKLISWANSVVTGTAQNPFASNGGSIFCNGNLKIGGTHIGGDVRVKGNLTISQKTVIDGSLTVGGTLKVDDNLEVGTSLEANKLVKNSNIKVHGSDINPTIELNPGYTKQDNARMGVAKPGYTVYNNNHYDFEEVIIDHTYWIETKYKDKFGNEYGEYTPVGHYSNGYYLETDSHGNETETLTSQAFTAYDSSGNKVDSWNMGNAVEEVWVEVDSSGNPLTPPEDHITTETVSFFDGSGNKVDSSVAMTLSGIAPATGEIYPENMKREKIYGDTSLDYTCLDSEGNPTVVVTCDSNTQIVKNITDMQKKVGMLPNGDTPTYITACPETPDAAHTYNGNVPNVITESCVIQGSLDHNIRIEQGANDIWVILRNCTFGSEKEIVVDSSATGSVKFFVEGEFKCEKSHIRPDNITDGCTVNWTDKMNIEWYGAEGSMVHLYNGGTICGAARAPKTTLKADGSDNIMKIDYVGKYTTEEDMVTSWIGNALFKKFENQNNFRIAYTLAGDDSDSSTLKTALGDYELSYFAEY